MVQEEGVRPSLSSGGGRKGVLDVMSWKNMLLPSFFKDVAMEGLFFSFKKAPPRGRWRNYVKKDMAEAVSSVWEDWKRGESWRRVQFSVSVHWVQCGRGMGRSD